MIVINRSESINRTLSRIGSVGGFIGGFIPALWDGLSKEFARVMQMRDTLYCTVVPNTAMCTEALGDLENKYGLDTGIELTDNERIARIIERAQMNGAGGKDWFDAQIQAAGFPLYVIENIPIAAVTTQYGSVQYSESTQMAQMPKRTDPANVSGVLITSSPNKRGGAAVASSSQCGTAMMGTSQYGSPDTSKSYPRPAERQLPTDPTLWNRVFFLSPFADRLATNDELLIMGDERIAYLRKLVEQIKYLRNWCIAQVATDIYRITDDGETRITDDDEIRRV